jgi:hypothetical protein
MSTNNNHDTLKKRKWDSVRDSITEWEEWHDDMKTKMRAAEGGYLLEPALIIHYNPAPVPAFVPVPPLPAGGLVFLGTPGANQAETDRRLKAIDRYYTQLNAHNTEVSRVTTLRTKHRATSDKCCAILQDSFVHECAAGRTVRNLITNPPAGAAAAAADPHLVFQGAFDGLAAIYRPNKPVNAQIYMDRLHALRSDDGRGWAMYHSDFLECMDALIDMGQEPSVGNAQSYLTVSFRHIKLMHFLTSLITTNNADVAAAVFPVVPRWRTFLEEVTLQINASATFDIVADVQAFADSTTNGGAPRPPFCYRCWRLGHTIATCMSTSCAGCGATFAIGEFHETRNAQHVKPNGVAGAGNGGGGGRGSIYGPGGRGGRDGGRGGRGGRDGGRGRGGRDGGRGRGGRISDNNKRPHDYESGGKHHDGNGKNGKKQKKAKANQAKANQAQVDTPAENQAKNSAAADAMYNAFSAAFRASSSSN